jgi:cytochrome c peroxidase
MMNNSNSKSAMKLAALIAMGVATSAIAQSSSGVDASIPTVVDHEVIGLEGLELARPQMDPPLWVPSAPLQNPPTEAKRVLGKILFWEEQLSSDNTTSCGTCHIPSSGGADPRIGRHPGFDESLNTDDDVLGSPGVIASDEMDQYLRDALFGLEPQVTNRVAQTNLMAMYNANLFWDGRAELNFIDPESGELLFQSGVAGLEIQALAPIMSTVEMSHAGRTWNQVREKLTNSRPMALARDLPADMQAAIDADSTYPELFEEAFGDPEINAVRIAYAMATYQRTLVPDESPWDLWNLGDESAMTAQQIQGYTLFQASACTFCHPGPTFANSDFFVDGIRPPFEDTGRMGVTGLASDRGAFRTPSIRNAGLRNRMMHNGGLADINEIMDFYARRNGQQPFLDNLDGFGPIVFNVQGDLAVKEFLQNGLTDPRVENETFPFDRPALYSERMTPNPEVVGAGQAGTSGIVPKMIAVVPPNLGNDDFKIGVDEALGGAMAWVAVSSSAPVDGVVASDELLGPITLNGAGSGMGFGTMFYPIADNPALDGSQLYMQWVIADPAGDGGFSRSAPARLDLFCSESLPCTIACVGDFNADGSLNFLDVSAFLNAFSVQSSAADVNGDGSFNFLDVSAFLAAFGQGCP